MVVLKPQDNLGRYCLVEKLGVGGFCEGWRAVHTELGSQVTIKVPHDPNYRMLLRQEGTLLAQLCHPGIVQVLDMDLAHDPPYVVQQFVDGTSLRDLIKAGPTDPGQALDLFRQLMEILDYSHGAGVIHRDVKPENLIAGKDELLHLLDFGLGLAEEEATRELLVSHSLHSGLDTSIAGTLNYMSPEQKAGERVDHRADLYAAGIVLFELLTGRYPTLNDRPGRHLPPERGAVINTVYGKLVAPLGERYESAREALEELDLQLEQVDHASLPLLPAAGDPTVVEAQLVAEEPNVWMRSVPTGCGGLIGWFGLFMTTFAVFGVLRGISAFRFLVLVGLMLLFGFTRRKPVPWAYCPYCRTNRQVHRKWPAPWTCRHCRQPISS